MVQLNGTTGAQRVAYAQAIRDADMGDHMAAMVQYYLMRGHSSWPSPERLQWRHNYLKGAISKATQGEGMISRDDLKKIIKGMREQYQSHFGEVAPFNLSKNSIVEMTAMDSLDHYTSPYPLQTHGESYDDDIDDER